MTDTESPKTGGAPGSGARSLLRIPALRISALLAWTLLLAAFWLGMRGAYAGPVEYLFAAVEYLSSSRLAPAGLLALYLLRPLLLVPVTVLNLASGLLLGPAQGVALALTGTLLSASVGYAIGRFIGSATLVMQLSERWRIVRLLRERSFETVVAGGLMYLHADMVNLPSGLLRIHFPTFLAGITVGNGLTLTMAVLAGASVEGGLASAKLEIELEYLALAAVLLLVSLSLAYLLRRRMQPTS